MKRSMEKAIEEYNRTRQNATGATGAFYYSDIQQIKEIAQSHNEDLYTDLLDGAILAALQAGFSVGYRTAKRQYKKQ